MLCHHPIQTLSPQHSYSDTSPRLSPCSDNASSASDFESEPDQVSTHFKQPPRKKRQRTTFSPTEVWELERAYRRQPYLTSEDEEDLVQRLGITAKSLKVRFSRSTNDCIYLTVFLLKKIARIIYLSFSSQPISLLNDRFDYNIALQVRFEDSSFFNSPITD